MKIFFEYIITKKNKELKEEMKEDRRALRDNMEKQHRELLECLHSETKKNTGLINQVKKVTEEEIIRIDEKITEVSEELDKVNRDSAQTNSVVEEVTNKVLMNETGTEDKFQKLDKKVEEAGQIRRQSTQTVTDCTGDTSSNYKLQTLTLVREGAGNCLTVQKSVMVTG
jgi:methyl-accepting chemotaxis protein